MRTLNMLEGIDCSYELRKIKPMEQVVVKLVAFDNKLPNKAAN